MITTSRNLNRHDNGLKHINDLLTKQNHNTSLTIKRNATLT